MVVFLCVFAYTRHTGLHGAVKGEKGGYHTGMATPALPERMATVERSEQQWANRGSARYVWRDEDQTGRACCQYGKVWLIWI